MKNLLLLFALVLSFTSCNQAEVLPDPVDEVQITTQQKAGSTLYTITVQFQQGSCTMSGKAKAKLHSELDAIKANHPNMALVQVTGNAWEWTLQDGTFICQCRADAALSYFNRWASTTNTGQSFGITSCINHIHSGLENQVAVLQIDAFL